MEGQYMYSAYLKKNGHTLNEMSDHIYYVKTIFNHRLGLFPNVEILGYSSDSFCSFS